MRAGGRAWILLGSRKQLKARKRLEKRAESHLWDARCTLHALLGGAVNIFYMRKR
jgi:hypothetical protein